MELEERISRLENKIESLENKDGIRSLLSSYAVAVDGKDRLLLEKTFEQRSSLLQRQN